MKKTTQVVALVVFLFSLALVSESRKLVYFSPEGQPGAGFFPFWLGVMLALLSLALFFQNRTQAGERDSEGPFAHLGRLSKPALILASLFVVAFLMQYLGFLVTIGLFLVFVMVLVEKYRWRTGLATAVLGAGFFYLLFQVWLEVPLPIGVLGI